MSSSPHFGPRYPRELGAIRRGMGLTQAQAAKRVGVSRETFSRIERGASCSLLTEHLIVSRLGLTPEQHRRAFGLPGPRTPMEAPESGRHPQLVIVGGRTASARR